MFASTVCALKSSKYPLFYLSPWAKKKHTPLLSLTTLSPMFLTSREIMSHPSILARANSVNLVLFLSIVNPNAYNGCRKIIADSSMFMTSLKILKCVDGLKLKNTEGYDRIPQRILIEGREPLMGPLTNLFKLIYRDQVIIKKIMCFPPILNVW